MGSMQRTGLPTDARARAATSRSVLTPAHRPHLLQATASADRFSCALPLRRPRPKVPATHSDLDLEQLGTALATAELHGLDPQLVEHQHLICPVDRAQQRDQSPYVAL